MANKAVVGAAAFAGGFYAASEAYKLRKCEKEEEESKKRWEEVEQFRLQGQREGQKKQQIDPFDFHTKALDNFFHQRMNLIRHVREVAESHHKKDLFAEMKLPFLVSAVDAKKEYNSPAEMMLGAALALGHPPALNETMALLDPLSLPGLALTKLSEPSVMLLTEMLEKIARSTLLQNVSLWSVLKEGKEDLLRQLVNLAKMPEVANGPVAVERKIPAFLNSDTRQAYEQTAVALGMFIIPASLFEKPKPVLYDNRGYPVEFKFKCKVKKRPKKGFSLWNIEDIVITNFVGSYSLCGHVTDDGSSMTGGSIKIENQDKRLRRPNVDAALRLYGDILTVKAFVEAARRLKTLVKTSDDSGTVSLEHISVSAGYEGEVLEQSRNTEINMIERYSEQIHSLIQTKLLGEIPCPDQDLSKVYSGGPTEALKLEVSRFAKNYVELIKWVHCVIPRHNGNRPSERVPLTSVDNVAVRLHAETVPRSIHQIRRRLELDERDRLVRSRRLVAPSPLLVAGCIAVITVTVFIICYLTTKEALFYTGTTSAGFFMLANFGSFLLSVWTVDATFAYLQRPLLVERTDNNSAQPQQYGTMLTLRLEGVWKTASNLAEMLVRRWREFRGQSNAFDQRLLHLKMICTAQHKTWCQRIAVRNYYESMRRKRITFGSCQKLLMDMDGILPGSLDLGEAFLQLEVEEEDESINVGKVECGSCFAELKASIEAVLQTTFPVGTRVLVSALSSTDSARVSQSHGLSHAVSSLVATTTSGSLSSTSPKVAGSVVSAIPDKELLVVHIDGDAVPVIVTSKQCEVLLEEAPVRGRHHDDEPLDRDEERDEKVAVEDASESGSDDVSATREETDLDRHFDHSQRNRKVTKRSRTIEEALTEGGWQFRRMKNHIRYSRRVRAGDAETTTQHFTMASTPSDHRAGKNALARLNRLNREHDVVQDVAPKGHLTCTACGEVLAEDKFSGSQLKKANGLEQTSHESDTNRKERGKKATYLPKCKQCVDEAQRVGRRRAA